MTFLVAQEAGSNLIGVALVITAFTGLFVGMGGLFIQYKTLKPMRTITHDTNARVAAMEPKLDKVDVAVNGKGPGEQTIGEEVSDLHAEIPPGNGGAVSLTKNGGGVIGALDRIEALATQNAHRIDQLEHHEKA